MSVVEKIPFENVMSIVKVMDNVMSSITNKVEQLWMGKMLVEYDPDLQNVEVSTGDTITLELDDNRLNGQYVVLDVKTSSRGYEQVLVQYRTPEGQVAKAGIPVWLRMLDTSKVKGKIYFGKRNVITATGGIATQIASTDFGKVIIGLAVLAVIVGAVYQFFIVGSQSVNQAA